MAAGSLIKEFCGETTCSICLDYFREPVTIECGHNFCQACLTRCWAESDRGASCPRCREVLQQKNFKPNRQLANLVELVKKLRVGKGVDGEQGKCERHQEPLKLICFDDQAPICVVCDRSTEHRNHRVLPVEEAFLEYKKEIQAELQSLEQEKGTLQEQKVADDQRSQTFLTQLQAEKKKTKSAFQQLQNYLEKEEHLRLSRLEEMEKEMVKRNEENGARFSEEVSHLSRLITEMEEKFQQSENEFLQDPKTILSRDRERAMAAGSLIKEFCEETTCSVCLDYFREPVTIECGHNFCQACLTQCWAKSDTGASCPLCGEVLQQKNFKPNRQLANLVELVKKLQMGKGVEGEQGRCERHQEPLKLICFDDQTTICVVCGRSMAHRNHRVLPMEEAFLEFKKEIQAELQSLEQEKGTLQEQKVADDQRSQTFLTQLELEKKKNKSAFQQLHTYLEKEERLRLSVLEEMEEISQPGAGRPKTQLELEKKKNKSAFQQLHTYLEKEERLRLSVLEEMEEKMAKRDKENCVLVLKDPKTVQSRYVKEPERQLLGPPLELEEALRTYAQKTPALEQALSKCQVNVTLDLKTTHPQLIVSPEMKKRKGDITLNPDEKSWIVQTECYGDDCGGDFGDDYANRCVEHDDVFDDCDSFFTDDDWKVTPRRRLKEAAPVLQRLQFTLSRAATWTCKTIRMWIHAVGVGDTELLGRPIPSDQRRPWLREEAMAARSLVKEFSEETTCSVCLDYFKEPVTIECGHNFCQACLTRCWAESVTGPSCPQCRKASQQQNFKPNWQLVNLVELVRKLQAGNGAEAKWGGCERHREPLKLFCFDDQAPICVVCDRSMEHRNHRVLPMEEALLEYKGVMAGKKNPSGAQFRKRKAERAKEQAKQAIREEEQYWRPVLERLVAMVKFLGMQHLAFHGTNENSYRESNGHFLKLVELLALFDPILTEHVRRVKDEETMVHYLGKDIQNELLELLASAIRQNILAHVNSAKYYSVILDCTPDVSHTEQMTATVRFVSVIKPPDTEMSEPEVTIREHFLGFVLLKETTGAFMTETLLGLLDQMGLPLEDLRGQSYDNGSNMRGKEHGVQKRVLDINPRAFFVPCSAHSLNLVVSDVAKCCLEATSFFMLVQQIYNYFSASTHRWQILTSHVPAITVKPLSQTRWESRTDALQPLRYHLGSIYDALMEIFNDSSLQESSTSDSRVEAKALADAISKFKFVVSLVTWYKILFEIHLTDKLLQNKETDLNFATSQLQVTKNYLVGCRCDEAFEQVLVAATKIAKQLEMLPNFETEQRQRRKKKQFESEAPEEAPQDPKQQFKANFYYAVLDVAIQSVEERSQQLQHCNSVFGFLYDIYSIKEKCTADLRKACKNLEQALTHDGNRDIDAEELCYELQAVARRLPKPMPPQRVLLHILQQRIQDSVPNVCIALRILLTLPVSVASGERSFSKLKLIKTHIRSTMLQERLLDLATISVEHAEASVLDLKELVTKFAKEKARKMRV
ncbi:PREDICTED: uncharacterized protein LOC107113656 [Gekko japonicus]|uniref:Uncharacterized protein LOC107113656 n=1 Tax=Gekko japonicus TaxID=146911 RepID=A0ABM1K9V9_GEKJA|nr:PREDICTED: uncharacterized protein LOC107113656 [Gekko japonicus]